MEFLLNKEFVEIQKYSSFTNETFAPAIFAGATSFPKPEKGSESVVVKNKEVYVFRVINNQ